MTQNIPEQVIDARLTVDGGKRYVELIERVAVPVNTDTEVVELAAIGRLVRAAAGRYGGALTELIAPLRDAVLALPDPEPGPADDLAAFEAWRHAALCLLDHALTGRPIDFKGRPVPDAIQGPLMVKDFQRFAHGPNSLAEAAGPAHEYTGRPVDDAATEVLPRFPYDDGAQR